MEDGKFMYEHWQKIFGQGTPAWEDLPKDLQGKWESLAMAVGASAPFHYGREKTDG